MNFYKNKKVLVTGGTGLIGRPLVNMLLKEDAQVTVVSLDKPSDISDDVIFKNVDLRNFNNCLSVCQNQEIIFNLVGVKGSPKMTIENPASFFIPTITFSINMTDQYHSVSLSKWRKRKVLQNQTQGMI